MMRHPHLSVEIFRDSLTPHIPTASIEHGIELLAEIAPNIRLESSVRTMRIPNSEESYIRADMFKPPRISADLGIVVTGRILAREEDLDANGELVKDFNKKTLTTVGLAYNKSEITSRKIALICIGPEFNEPSADTITEHETAHLLNVKNDGESHDGHGHCIDTSCILSAVIEPITNARPSRGKKRTQSFCGECSEQVFRNASILRDIKAGKRVSAQLKSHLL